MAYFFDFEKLEVWHLSVDLAEEIYRLTSAIGETENSVWVTTMRQTAVLISTHLAAGSVKDSPYEQSRYTQTAYTCLLELLSQLIIGHRIGCMDASRFSTLRSAIEKLAHKIDDYRQYQLSRVKESEISDSSAEQLPTETKESYSAISHSRDSFLHQLLSKNGYFFHPTAIIDPGASIGKNTRIWHYSHVMSGAEIGTDCNLGQNVFIADGAKIGKGVKIQNNVSIYRGVYCEDEVFVGPSVVFTNVMNPRSHVARKSEYRSTTIKKGASIGANATIVCGLQIGQYAFVAAGATVTKDVLPYALVQGNPARQKGWMSEYGCKLTFDRENSAICPESGEKYQLINEIVHKVY